VIVVCEIYLPILKFIANTPSAKKAYIVEQLSNLDRLLSTELSEDDISHEIRRLAGEKNFKGKRTSNSLAPLHSSDSSNLQKLLVVITRQAEQISSSQALTELLKEEYNLFSAYQAEGTEDCVKKVCLC
jgi:hypothetical protein